jgi:hypothetical protein
MGMILKMRWGAADECAAPGKIIGEERNVAAT